MQWLQQPLYVQFCVHVLCARRFRVHVFSCDISASTYLVATRVTSSDSCHLVTL